MDRLRRGLRSLFFGALVPASLACTPAAAQSFGVTEIGTLWAAYGSIYPIAISANGTTIAGTTPNNAAFIWSAATGQTSLGLPSSVTASSAQGISSDGSVVVGDYNSSNVNSANAFRWTRASGLVDLGTLNPSIRITTANGVSGDGSVVVGSSFSTTTAASGAPNLASHAYIWTAATGMVDLMPGSTSNGSATAVSTDGRVVVGAITATGFHPAALPTTAFRWSSATGITTLTALSTAFPGYSAATAVNADGGIVAGDSATTSGNLHAVRWDAAGTVVDLGTLGGSTSHAAAVNAAGTVIVGYSTTAAGGQIAFRWTPVGMQDLNQALGNAGVNLGGIALTGATGVSADGQFIAATGRVAGDSTARGYLVTYAAGIGGVTTPADLVASITQLRQAQSRLMAQQHGIAAMLLGEYLPLAAGSEIGGFAAIGSATGGAGGRVGLAEGFSVRVAAADTQQHYQGVSQNGAAITALSLRYVHGTAFDAGIQVRPVAELGGWYAPDLPLAFSRSYANGSGTAIGRAATRGTMNYLYGRLGGSLAVSPTDDLLLSGEFGREYFSSSSWSEAFSVQNPFNAAVAGTDTSLLLGKLQAKWTHSFASGLDATLFVAGARSLSASGAVNATIAGLSPVSAGVSAGAIWAEYGARLGWRFGRTTLDVFAGGVAGGANSVGSSIHGGAGLRVAF